MKIIELRSENVKRIAAVSIKPDGSLVVIKGNNGQGKTSVLDSIMYALAGEKTHAPRVIRDGEKKARVELDLGEYLVERRWTESGSSLSVKSKDGASYASPQKLLDGLVGKLSFDPLGFQRLDPKRQAEMLRQLVGLDFRELEARRASVYATRTEINREAERIRGSLARMPEVAGPVAHVDMAELLAEHEKAVALKQANDVVRQSLAAAQQAYRDRQGDVESAKRLVARIEAELEQARTDLAIEEKRLQAAAEMGKAIRARVDALVDPDLAAVANRLRTAEATNAAAGISKLREEETARLHAKQEEAARCTAAIEKIDAEKDAALAAAKFPVPGLAFVDDGVTFNGLPLEQASSAEQLRVSLAMGIALNPKLKVMLIRDGSLLDEKSLALVAEMAEAAGAQCWIERVGKAGEVGVVIEDGHVEGAEAPAGRNGRAEVHA